VTPARDRAVAIGALLVGAALLLLAGGRVWFTARAGEPGLPSLPVSLSGRDVAAVVSAAGLLALAAAAVVLLVGGIARRVVGGVVVVVGLVALWRCGYVLTHRAAAALDAAASRPDGSGASTVTSPTMTAWPWLALVGAVLVVVGGAAVALRGGRWPDRSTRYDADAVPVAPSGKASAEPVDVSDAMWKALDRGEDPTAGDDPPDAPEDPDRS
jgi:uncharacterized membrane protein (TIGR02234 family)